jgi:chromosome segregation ATPase
VETPPAEPTGPAGQSADLLARLRMPGKSGPIPVPTPRPAAPAVPAMPEPTPTRPPSVRRVPSNTAYTSAYGPLNSLVDTEETPAVDEQVQAEIKRVRLENKELRKLLHEMKQLLQEASESEQQWAAKQKTIDETVAAKDKQIEELSTQLGAIEEQIAKGELAPPPPVPKTRTELEEWSDELEKENAKLQQDKKKLEDERRQLREDEESLEAQMREMEVSMARERALLARQETELRRLNTEIQHELELMQRGDAALREQMAKFQRRAQEVLVKPQPANGRR